MTNPPPAECLSMTQVKTILELYEQTCSYLRTVSEVGVSHNTVKKYLIRAQVSTANSCLQGVSTRKIQEIVSHPGSITFLRLRSPRWRRDSTTRCRHSSCGRSNRRSRTSSWMLHTTKGVRWRTLRHQGGHDCRRESLGARITDCESEEFWSGQFR